MRFFPQIEEFIEHIESREEGLSKLRSFVALGQREPDFLPLLMGAIMDRLPFGGRYINFLLSYLNEGAWPELATRAVKRLLRESENIAAVWIVRQAVLQRPMALHAYLEALFEVERRYKHGFLGAFRDAGLASVHFLFDRCGSRDEEDRRLACQALLETRQPYAMEFARIHGEGFSAYLPEVGFTLGGGAFRQLYPDYVLHLAFSTSYIARLSPEITLRNFGLVHPTWEPAGGGAPTHRFGGLSGGQCAVCERSLARLILLDPVPEGMGVTGLSRLELCACLSCLGWEREILYYQHAEGGAVAACASGEPELLPPLLRDSESPPLLLAECEVALVDRGPRFRTQDWVTGQNLHRLGGEPLWLKSAAYPSCPSCSAACAFLMQLDSELLTPNDRGWLWGRGGLAFAFFCDRCKISGVLWQCV